MSADGVAPPPRNGNAAFHAMFWPPVAPRVPVVLGAPPGAAPAYAQAAYTNEINLLAAAIDGERNDTLNKAAFNLAQLVASGHLPREQVIGDLHGVAIMVGLTERETAATLRSAFGAGEKHPRAVPEPSVLDVPEVTVLSWPDQPPGAIGAPTMPPGVEEVPAADIADAFPVLDWVALWEDDTAEEWIVEPILPARRLVALFSPPKIGKSLLMLEVAVAVARGESVLGSPRPDRPRRVLYVDFENDPRGDVRTRLQAMDRKPEDLSNLLYLSFPQLPYLDTPLGGLTLVRVVERYGAEVVVIDTISRGVGGDENENDTWLSFYRHTGVALKARGITCIRLDHTGKDPTKGMRGGSAKYGDVDAVWAMTDAGADRLHLECTANRLPIAEKHLHLIRRVEPLRHEVDVRTTGQVHHDVIVELAKCLDRIGWPKTEPGRKAPDGAGAIPARKALIELGWEPEGDNGATDYRVREALKRRQSEGWIPAMPEQGTLQVNLATDGLATDLATEDRK